MILIISPFYDIPTSTSIQAAGNLERYCKEHNINYKLLFGIQTLRPLFEVTMMFNNIDLIAYFGHGVKDGLLGQHLGIFKMLDTINAHTIKDVIVYAMACHSGAELGPKAIEKGAISYFGHNTWFYGAFPNEKYDYLKDWVDYVTIIPKALILGKTTGEALNDYRKIIDKYLNRYEANRYLDWDWYTTTLQSNRDYLKLYGNQNTRLNLE